MHVKGGAAHVGNPLHIRHRRVMVGNTSVLLAGAVVCMVPAQ